MPKSTFYTKKSKKIWTSLQHYHTQQPLKSPKTWSPLNVQYWGNTYYPNLIHLLIYCIGEMKHTSQISSLWFFKSLNQECSLASCEVISKMEIN